jgi:hypothetical protein
MLIRAWLFITTIMNFYQRTARGIHKLGYAPACATRYARFFFISLLSVCTAAGVLDVPPEAATGSNTGSGKFLAGARPGITVPGFFGLRHH